MFLNRNGQVQGSIRTKYLQICFKQSLVLLLCDWSKDLVFGYLKSMISYIARGRLQGLMICLVPPSLSVFSLSLQLSTLFVFLVALPFVMFFIPDLDSVLLRVCSVDLDVEHTRTTLISYFMF